MVLKTMEPMGDRPEHGSTTLSTLNNSASTLRGLTWISGVGLGIGVALAAVALLRKRQASGSTEGLMTRCREAAGRLDERLNRLGLSGTGTRASS
jgi:hypothetical protein